MTTYSEMTKAELETLQDELMRELDGFRAKGLSLNMARGKPGAEQLELSLPMLDIVNSSSKLFAEDGSDCRNYGVLTGIPEAKRLLGDLVGARPEQVIVCGNASLNVMYDTVARAMTDGIMGSTPWARLDTVKFLCPAPGYDRHFNICEHFGIEMIPIEMTPDGPDMARVKELVEGDEAVKGIWCVPQYSNPQGYSYSDETVRTFASLSPAAKDFRIFWDNAYCVHHLYGPDQQDHVLNILEECAAAGNPDMVYEFCSTSKVTLPGAGISAFISSEANIEATTKAMGAQTIGHDKINQLRHVRFLRDAEGVAEHMAKHAELLRPRFETVLRVLEEDLGGTGVGSWIAPRGGYFISFDGPNGTAKRTVELAKSAGVQMTGAGATWPYGNDPRDSNIRIAPSFPSLDELEQAARIFTVCARLAAIEQLVSE